MISFERNRDPKKALAIGRVSQRVFDDIKEAAIWFSKYPEAYTDGLIEDWAGTNPNSNQPFFDQSNGSFHHAGFVGHKDIDGKLGLVKWVKLNIHFSKYPEAIIGLKEAKQIVDLAERIISMRLFKEKFDMEPETLDKLEDFVKGIRIEMREEIHEPGDYRRGFLAACKKIDSFIKNCREDET